MHRYGKSVFISNFYQKLKSKKWYYQFRVTKNCKQTFVLENIKKKSNSCFNGDSNIEGDK